MNLKKTGKSNYTQYGQIASLVVLMALIFVCSTSAKSTNNFIYEKVDSTVKVVKVKGYTNGINYKERVYDHVKKMPSFPGGRLMLNKYLHDNLVYPHQAAEKKIMGKVVIQFIVRKNGCITNACLLRSVEPEIDAEAIRLVESMPKWIPGEKNKRPVNVKYTLYVDFILDK